MTWIIYGYLHFRKSPDIIQKTADNWKKRERERKDSMDPRPGTFLHVHSLAAPQLPCHSWWFQHSSVLIPTDLVVENEHIFETTIYSIPKTNPWPDSRPWIFIGLWDEITGWTVQWSTQSSRCVEIKPNGWWWLTKTGLLPTPWGE